MADVLLRNGLIYDGSGNPPFEGDIAVSEGRIAVVAARIDASASQEFDLQGLAVAPGFIDSHAHDDYACIAHARQQGGLSHHLFNLRARTVLGEIQANELRTRLSALIIGHELTEMLAMFPSVQRVAVVGNETLGAIYCEALASRGAEAAHFSGEAAASRGAMRLARLAGILE